MGRQIMKIGAYHYSVDLRDDIKAAVRKKQPVGDDDMQVRMPAALISKVWIALTVLISPCGWRG